MESADEKRVGSGTDKHPLAGPILARGHSAQQSYQHISNAEVLAGEDPLPTSFTYTSRLPPVSVRLISPQDGSVRHISSQDYEADIAADAASVGPELVVDSDAEAAARMFVHRDDRSESSEPGPEDVEYFSAPSEAFKFKSKPYEPYVLEIPPHSTYSVLGVPLPSGTLRVCPPPAVYPTFAPHAFDNPVASPGSLAYCFADGLPASTFGSWLRAVSGRLPFTASREILSNTFVIHADKPAEWVLPASLIPFINSDARGLRDFTGNPEQVTAIFVLMGMDPIATAAAYTIYSRFSKFAVGWRVWEPQMQAIRLKVCAELEMVDLTLRSIKKAADDSAKAATNVAEAAIHAANECSSAARLASESIRRVDPIIDDAAATAKETRSWTEALFNSWLGKATADTFSACSSFGSSFWKYITEIPGAFGTLLFKAILCGIDAGVALIKACLRIPLVTGIAVATLASVVVCGIVMATADHYTYKLLAAIAGVVLCYLGLSGMIVADIYSMHSGLTTVSDKLWRLFKSVFCFPKSVSDVLGEKSLLKFLGSIEKTYSGVAWCWEKFSAVAISISKWVLDFCGFDSRAYFTSIYDPFNDWMDAVRVLNEELLSRPTVVSDASRIRHLLAEGRQLAGSDRRKVPKDIRAAYERVDTLLGNLALKIRNARGGKYFKLDPCTFMFTSAPGVGKSFGINMMLPWIINHPGAFTPETVELFKTNSGAVVYPLTAEVKYDTGYNHHVVKIHDEFDAATSVTGDNISDAARLIRLKSNLAVAMNMADIESKGTADETELYLMMGNREKILTHDLYPEALARRLTGVFRVVPALGYASRLGHVLSKADGTPISPSSGFEMFDEHAWKFELLVGDHNGVTATMNARCEFPNASIASFTFREVCHYIGTKMVAAREKFELQVRDMEWNRQCATAALQGDYFKLLTPEEIPLIKSDERFLAYVRSLWAACPSTALSTLPQWTPDERAYLLKMGAYSPETIIQALEETHAPLAIPAPPRLKDAVAFLKSKSLEVWGSFKDRKWTILVCLAAAAAGLALLPLAIKGAMTLLRPLVPPALFSLFEAPAPVHSAIAPTNAKTWLQALSQPVTMHGLGGANQNSMDMLACIRHWCWNMVTSDGAFSAVNFQGLAGQACLTNRHTIAELKELYAADQKAHPGCRTIIRLRRIDDKHGSPYPCDLGRMLGLIEDIGAQEHLVVIIPELPTCKDIRKYHATFQEIAAAYAPTVLISGEIHRKGTSIFFNVPGMYITNYTVASGACVTGFSYSFPTEPGDCVSPIMLTRLKHPVVGYHIAGNKSCGIAEAISRDQLEKIRISQPQVSEWPKPVDLEYPAEMHCKVVARTSGRTGVLFKLDKPFPTSTRNTLVKSIYYSQFPTSEQPAQLAEHEGRDPFHAIRDADHIPHAVSHEGFISVAARLVFSEDRSVFSDIPMRVLTNQEAIHGVPELDSVAVGTTEFPGLLYTPSQFSGTAEEEVAYHRHPDRSGFIGKRLPAYRPPEPSLHARLCADVAHIEELLAAGINPCRPAAKLKKAELRAPGKIVRDLNASDLPMLVIGKKYFATYLARWKSKMLMTGHLCGVDPVSDDWTIFASLLRPYQKFLALDHKKSDIHFKMFLSQVIAREVSHDMSSLGLSEREVSIACNYIVCNFQTLVTCIDNDEASSKQVYLAWCEHNITGWFLTAFMATTCARVLQTYACLAVLRLKGIPLQPVLSAPQKYWRMWNIGDDHIIAFTDQFPEFTPADFVRAGAEAGIELRSPDNSEPHFTFNVEDLEICQRTFRWEDTISRFVAPLKLESIHGIISWYRTDGPPPSEQVALRKILAAHAYALHGRDAYDEFVSKAHIAEREANVPPSAFLPWREALSEALRVPCPWSTGLLASNLSRPMEMHSYVPAGSTYTTVQWPPNKDAVQDPLPLSCPFLPSIAYCFNILQCPCGSLAPEEKLKMHASVPDKIGSHETTSFDRSDAHVGEVREAFRQPLAPQASPSVVSGLAQTIESVFGTPLLIETFSLTSVTSVGYRYTEFTYLLQHIFEANPLLETYLNDRSGISATICIQLRSSSTPQSSGCVMATWVPITYWQMSGEGGDTATKIQDNYTKVHFDQLFNFPSVILYPSCESSATIRLPYQGPSRWIVDHGFYDSLYVDAGVVLYSAPTPAYSDTNLSTQNMAEISVYAWFEDVKLGPRTFADPEEMHSGKIDPALLVSAVSTSSSSVDAVDVQNATAGTAVARALARPVSTAAHLIGDVLAASGMSHDNPSNFMLRPSDGSPYLHAAEGPIPAVPLSFSRDPSDGVGSKADEDLLDLNSFCGRFHMISDSIADAAGASKTTGSIIQRYIIQACNAISTTFGGSAYRANPKPWQLIGDAFEYVHADSVTFLLVYTGPRMFSSKLRVFFTYSEGTYTTTFKDSNLSSYTWDLSKTPMLQLEYKISSLHPWFSSGRIVGYLTLAMEENCFPPSVTQCYILPFMKWNGMKAMGMANNNFVPVMPLNFSTPAPMSMHSTRPDPERCIQSVSFDFGATTPPEEAVQTCGDPVSNLRSVMSCSRTLCALPTTGNDTLCVNPWVHVCGVTTAGVLTAGTGRIQDLIELAFVFQKGSVQLSITPHDSRLPALFSSVGELSASAASQAIFSTNYNYPIQSRTGTLVTIRKCAGRFDGNGVSTFILPSLGPTLWKPTIAYPYANAGTTLTELTNFTWYPQSVLYVQPPRTTALTTTAWIGIGNLEVARRDDYDVKLYCGILPYIVQGAVTSPPILKPLEIAPENTPDFRQLRSPAHDRLRRGADPESRSFPPRSSAGRFLPASGLRPSTHH